jgi:hypothetical protein
MPYDNPLPLDRAERLAAKRDAIHATPMQTWRSMER